MSEIAWLIERADPLHPGCVAGNCFLGMKGSYNPYGNGAGELTWMPTVDEAIRFNRKKDAVMFIGMMEWLHDKLPHGETLPGLRHGDPQAIAVEHSWDMARVDG